MPSERPEEEEVVPPVARDEDPVVTGEVLVAAARRADVTGLKEILDAGGSIDATDAEGYTALHVAASAGLGDVLDLLIVSGANLDARNALGDTPLHLAARAGHAEAIDALLAGGADSSVTNEAGVAAQDLIEAARPEPASPLPSPTLPYAYWPILGVGLALLAFLLALQVFYLLRRPGKEMLENQFLRFVVAFTSVLILGGLPGAGIVTEFAWKGEAGADVPTPVPQQAGPQVKLEGAGAVFFGVLVLLYRAEIQEFVLETRRRRKGDDQEPPDQKKP